MAELSQAEKDELERQALLNTDTIREWRSIVTLILFVVASALSPNSRLSHAV